MTNLDQSWINLITKQDGDYYNYYAGAGYFQKLAIQELKRIINSPGGQGMSDYTEGSRIAYSEIINILETLKYE